uniref:Uncharacterized protein n=1 Tax=Cannabis sativa TaxID=3483 RepID=A0A803PT51_CANSA
MLSLEEPTQESCPNNLPTMNDLMALTQNPHRHDKDGWEVNIDDPSEIGVKAPQREENFEQEFERAQARACLPIGPPLDMERPLTTERTNRNPPPGSPRRPLTIPNLESLQRERDLLLTSKGEVEDSTLTLKVIYAVTLPMDPVANNMSTSLGASSQPGFILEKSLMLRSRPHGQEKTTRHKLKGVKDRLGRSGDLRDTLTRRQLLEGGASRIDLGNKISDKNTNNNAWCQHDRFPQSSDLGKRNHNTKFVRI